ncbi:MAG: phosphatidate cytidylyltransferase [Armatimonadota bacterium]|nr:phosphatidate cytidylyltransferase [Armatimonadota bacterium]
MPESSGDPDRAMWISRVATVAVGAPLLIIILWRGGWALLLVVLALVALGTREFQRLALGVGYRTSPVLTGGALVFPVLAAWHHWDLVGPAVVAVVMTSAGLTLTAARRAGAPGSAAVDTLGALYLGALFAHLILLREAAGFALTVTLVAVIWVSDAIAFLVGRRWGRRRLAPAISPAKSVEGFAAGLVSGVVVAVVAAMWQAWPAATFGALGAIVVLAGVLGDLWKSSIKRAAGVKDSGRILPGHGGVIDRFDAILFGVPVGYYAWRWLM